MNINQLLRSFRRKLLWEGIAKSTIFSLIPSAFSLFVISLIYHILAKEPAIGLLAGVSISVFVISFGIVFGVWYFPTKKRIAKRMDELGLQERISTMLEFANEDTEMVKMQRTDAVEHLKKITPKQLKCRFSKWQMILCAVSVCLAVTMSFIPYDVFATPSSDNAEIIEDLIEELRKQVEESELSDELKEDLNEVVDKLEEELEDSDSELEQAAKIEQAKREMEELLKEAIEENPEDKEAIEEMMEQLEETFEEKKDELLGNEKGETIEEPEEDEESSEEETSEEETQEGEAGENQGEGQGEQQGAGEGQGQGQGEGTGMTEGIYDPILGNVPYGEVFASYYAEYLEALENGEVPKSLQEIIDQYFSSLN